MALKGIGEGVEGVVLDWNSVDRGREAMSAAFTSKDGDLEAGIEELVEDGRAQIPSGLFIFRGQSECKGIAGIMGILGRE